MAIDFEMTYPCSSPMLDVDLPVTATMMTASGDKVTAVVLITDSDLLQRFIKSSGLNGPHCQFRFVDAQSVATYLRRCLGYDDEVNPAPVTHVAIDPGLAPVVLGFPIREFVDHILA